jgi:large subunit ribosomal protein L21
LEANVYAIIEAGGKQYRVTPGASIQVESISANVGETLEIAKVLLLADDGEVLVGSPFVPGARVRATVTKQAKGRRVTVFKFVGGNRYQRKRGHRQGYASLSIEDIVLGGEEEERPAPAEKPQKEKTTVKRKTTVPQIPIAELELPARVLAALEGAGLRTAGDVLKLTDEELLAIRGLGPKSLEQVRTALSEKGLISD